jgi:YfiH family protein
MPHDSAENSWETPGVAKPAVLPAFPHLPGVRAFFTTRLGGVSTGNYASLNLGPFVGDSPEKVKANWGLLLASQGFSGRDPVLPRLCHGAALLDADTARGDARDTEADAVFTRTPGRVVAVTMADCLPALIADAESGCVAAVHAGWRGTRENILGHALERLFAAGLCRPATTHVALGPCLSPTALEIGAEVAATLPAAHVSPLEGRPHFDLRGCNRAQAIAAGLPPENIREIGGCTRGNADLFFSYRRAQAEAIGGPGVTGRMAACIALL